MRRPSLVVTLICVAAAATPAMGQQRDGADWPTYGGDAGGSRYSTLTQITRENVSQLAVAWTFHTGEGELKLQHGSSPALETTPILVDGTLYVTTPLGRVIALDPSTGTERWRFDPKINVNGGYGDFANRGVATWRDRGAATGAACARRIFVATIDARPIALDARTGTPCDGFGVTGAIDLRLGLRIAPFEFPAYEETSPPLVNDLVVVGSAIADNSRPAPASGEVRAFDARLPPPRNDPGAGRPAGRRPVRADRPRHNRESRSNPRTTTGRARRLRRPAAERRQRATQSPLSRSS